MFHHHESIDSGLVLAEHIERHHDVSTGSTYDWHWHLVLPSELCHGDGDSDAVPSTVVTAATTSGLSGCSSVTFGELDDVRRIDLSVFECVDPELGSLPEPMFVGACTHHLKPTVHTCALLCVMLC
ncbi:MAG: hypothetical protein HKN47_12805 [Pirellulaceae bacterium]|nr:hypothetical protein [Pirellulaceae bacterium]